MLPTLLIVDDEPDFLELLGMVLRGEGFGVELAADGIEAISKATSVHPELIVLDLMLPELDGTAVCEILRQTPSTTSIPILMLTGCSTDECKSVALNAGANEYLTKPCNLKHLVSRIKRMLTDQKRKERLLADKT